MKYFTSLAIYTLLTLFACNNIAYATQPSSEEDIQSAIKLIDTSQEKPDYRQALSLFESASNKGNLLAHRYIGSLYLHGQGVDGDIDTAIKHLELSASIRDSESQYILGSIYSDDSFGKKDFKLAMKWLSKPASHSILKAQLKLYRVLMDRGDKKYHKFARYWIKRAAKIGHANAHNN